MFFPFQVTSLFISLGIPSGTLRFTIKEKWSLSNDADSNDYNETTSSNQDKVKSIILLVNRSYSADLCFSSHVSTSVFCA